MINGFRMKAHVLTSNRLQANKLENILNQLKMSNRGNFHVIALNSKIKKDFDEIILLHPLNQLIFRTKP